jgi:putative two-component system response regulator
MLGDQVFGARVLIVDDEPEDIATLKEVLLSGGFKRVISTTDSSEALSLYKEFHPDIVLVDLDMPSPNGLELMKLLQGHEPGVNDPPMVIFTNEVADEVTEAVLGAGAVDFIRKPNNRNEVLVRVTNLLENYFMHFELRSQNETLEERVRQRTLELNDARLETLERLAIAAEFRDDDTGEHTKRVGFSSTLLAVAAGMPPEYVERMASAAPLHDVGKIGIPDAILLKPAKLTDEEFTIMQSHTTIGGEILRGGTSHVLSLADEIALTHHEKWNGKGYPNGLAGEAIPVSGRIVTLSDVFDALTHARPYKKAWPLDEAIAEIRESAGTHFDPALTTLFLEQVVPKIPS